MIDCLISFGSNLGNSRQIILDAVESLESGHPVFNLRISEFLITPPVGGPPGQPDFINGAARFDTNLTPLELLGLLHQTETDFGRERRIRWDSRTLDLDLLLYGNRILAENDCEIPHPRMSFRQFVLVPAQSIAAEMTHPVSRCSIGSLLERIQVVLSFPIFRPKQLGRGRVRELCVGEVDGDFLLRIGFFGFLTFEKTYNEGF